jgi:hypothetical protein
MATAAPDIIQNRAGAAAKSARQIRAIMPPSIDVLISATVHPEAEFAKAPKTEGDDAGDDNRDRPPPNQ